jgi:hypothetical protein
MSWRTMICRSIALFYSASAMPAALHNAPPWETWCSCGSCRSKIWSDIVEHRSRGYISRTITGLAEWPRGCTCSVTPKRLLAISKTSAPLLPRTGRTDLLVSPVLRQKHNGLWDFQGNSSFSACASDAMVVVGKEQPEIFPHLWLDCRRTTTSLVLPHKVGANLGATGCVNEQPVW